MIDQNLETHGVSQVVTKKPFRIEHETVRFITGENSAKPSSLQLALEFIKAEADRGFDPERVRYEGPIEYDSVTPEALELMKNFDFEILIVGFTDQTDHNKQKARIITGKKTSVSSDSLAPGFVNENSLIIKNWIISGEGRGMIVFSDEPDKTDEERRKILPFDFFIHNQPEPQNLSYKDTAILPSLSDYVKDSRKQAIVSVYGLTMFDNPKVTLGELKLILAKKIPDQQVLQGVIDHLTTIKGQPFNEIAEFLIHFFARRDGFERYKVGKGETIDKEIVENAGKVKRLITELFLVEFEFIPWGDVRLKEITLQQR